MTTIVSTVSSIITMMGSALTFITDQPLLLCLCCIPLVGGVIYLITSLFRG